MTQTTRQTSFKTKHIRAYPKINNPKNGKLEVTSTKDFSFEHLLGMKT